jgi:hypothetical protein
MMRRRCPSLLAPVLLVTMIGCGTNGPSRTSSPTPPAILFSLAGRVTAEDGVTVPSATISIVDGINQGKSATADSSGNYVLRELLPGLFTVKVTAIDHVASLTSVQLTSDATLALQVTRMAPWLSVVRFTVASSVGQMAPDKLEIRETTGRTHAVLTSIHVSAPGGREDHTCTPAEEVAGVVIGPGQTLDLKAGVGYCMPYITGTAAGRELSFVATFADDQGQVGRIGATAQAP